MLLGNEQNYTFNIIVELVFVAVSLYIHILHSAGCEVDVIASSAAKK